MSSNQGMTLTFSLSAAAGVSDAAVTALLTTTFGPSTLASALSTPGTVEVTRTPGTVESHHDTHAIHSTPWGRAARWFWEGASCSCVCYSSEWPAAVDVVRIAREYASEKLRHAASSISLDTAVLCVSTGGVPFRAQSLSLCRDFQCRVLL